MNEVNSLQFGMLSAPGYYIPNDTAVIASVRNTVDDGTGKGLQVTFKMRYHQRSGFTPPPDEQTLYIPADGKEYFFTRNYGDVYIQSIHLYCDRAVTVHRGQCFASVFAKFGTVPGAATPIFHTFAADYIETLKPVAFPTSGVQTSLQHQGHIGTFSAESVSPCPVVSNQYLIPQGAKREIFRYNVPSHIRIRPIALEIQYTPGTATKNIMLALLGQALLPDNQSPFFESVDAVATSSNPLVKLSWNARYSTNGQTMAQAFANGTAGNPFGSGGTLSTVYAMPMPDVYLTAGMSLVVVNDDSGADQRFLANFVYEQWIDPQDATNPGDPGNTTPVPPSGGPQ